ncbi:MAG: secretin N-terminal domain-containing protein [bacterium]
MIPLNPSWFKRGLGVTVTILFFFCFFVYFVAASDFDFYSSELIARESYRRISMDFKDASLKNILKILSEQAGLNFIAASNVQERTVTLYMDNVPLQEALNKIMSANNLKYDLDPGSNIFIVKEWGRPEVETVTKIYYLKYARLKASRLESAIASVSSAAGAAGGAAGASAGAAPAGGGGIEEAVKGVLTSNGKLMSEPRTNSLIITDIPSQFEVIDRVVALLDVSAPQVMIEVEMLDVSKKVVDEMGMDTSSSVMQLTGASRGTKFPFSTDNLQVAGPAFTYGTLSAAVFQATLDLLTTDTRTKFLARPRILTTSNETAEIKITTQEAIGVKTTTQSSEGAATQTKEAERYETGVLLKVTPQVDTRSGMVTMFIQPSVSVAKTGGTFEGQTFKDPEIRSSTTTLVVKHGETIVVGGLIRTSDEITIKKVPFLGDIPFLGAMFRHKNRTNDERELIVFITPRIIAHEEDMARARVETPTPAVASFREQSTRVVRQEEVDNMLERWED